MARARFALRPIEQGDEVSGGRFSNMKVVITGPSELTRPQFQVVVANVIGVLKDRPHTILLGGRRGAETAAYRICAQAKRCDMDLRAFHLVAVVAGWLGDAPYEFQATVRASHLVVAHAVSEVMDAAALKVLAVELGMDIGHPSSTRARDAVLLGRAGFSAVEGCVLAFMDGKCRATEEFVQQARDERMQIVEIPLPQVSA